MDSSYTIFDSLSLLQSSKALREVPCLRGQAERVSVLLKHEERWDWYHADSYHICVLLLLRGRDVTYIKHWVVWVHLILGPGTMWPSWSPGTPEQLSTGIFPRMSSTSSLTLQKYVHAASPGSGASLLNASWGSLHWRDSKAVICAHFFLVTYNVCLSLTCKVWKTRVVWEQKLCGSQGPGQ